MMFATELSVNCHSKEGIVLLCVGGALGIEPRPLNMLKALGSTTEFHLQLSMIPFLKKQMQINLYPHVYCIMISIKLAES